MMFNAARPLSLLSIFLLSSVWLTACSSHSQEADFILEDVNQKIVRLSDYRGQWVVLNYWATWCPPCRKEIPDLARLHQEKSNVTVIGIDEELLAPEKLAAFIQTHKIPYPIIPNFVGRQDKEAQKQLKTNFPLRGLPTTYVINPEGNIQHKFEGEVSFDQLSKLIP